MKGEAGQGTRGDLFSHSGAVVVIMFVQFLVINTQLSGEIKSITHNTRVHQCYQSFLLLFPPVPKLEGV